MNISIIIPIYNVAPFIRRCAESLFRQTMESGIEYIFVDDASPDDSVAIVKDCLESFPQRKEQVHILTHTANKGLPAARNTGLEAATGKYIFHCDSDDFLEENAMEELFQAAERAQADMVWCNWYLSFEKNERYMKQPCYATAGEALQGMLAGAMKYNVWNKLVQRSLYEENGIRFPEGYGMGEDMTMIRLCACAQQVVYLPKALYHYVRLNTNGFTQVRQQDVPDVRHLESLKHNVECTIQFVESRFGTRLEKELAFFQLEAKFPFLISCSRSSYRLWKAWFPEASRFILQNQYVSARSRFLQYMASKGQFWFVYLYNKVVLRLVYGLIYR